MADGMKQSPELGFRPLDLTAAPGHLMRRAQQIHTRVWALSVDGTLTSPQFAVLTALAKGGALDQATIGEMISLDRSTMTDIARRLEARGWLTRSRDPEDGRRRVLELTPEGRQLLVRVTPRVEQLGDELLGDLSEAERKTLLDLLGRLIAYGEHMLPAGEAVAG